ASTNLTMKVNPPDDSYEPNDDIDNASLITQGVISNLRCFNADYYKFTMNAGDKVYINVSFNHSEGDLDIRLYNPQKTQVAYNGSSSSVERITYTANMSGFYYLYVYGYNGATNPNYTISLVIQSGVPQPYLSGGGVSPSSGNESTTFNFSVNYTHPANTAPTVKNILIDGIPYPMSTTDTNYTDGSIFTYSTMLPVGTHNFSFNFSDGSTYAVFPASGNLTVTVTPGPSDVYNLTTVEAIMANPQAYNNTQVKIPNAYIVYVKNNYTFNVTDGPANTTQIMIYCALNSNYPNGIQNNTYVDIYGVVVPYGSIWEIKIRANTFDRVVNSSGSTNTPPDLLSPTRDPMSGNTSTLFTFFITYRDIDGDLPSKIEIILDGTPLAMTAADSSPVTTGRLYSYSTYLPAGNHQYRFTATDGVNPAVSTITFTDLTVSDSGSQNHAPTLSAPSVTPVSGSMSSSFVFRVTYTDEDNDPPSKIEVCIDGNLYDLYQANPADQNYKDGKVYNCSFTGSFFGSVPGTHSYYFKANDGRGGTAETTPSTFTITSQNNPPTLSSPSVSPSSGDTGTIFTFSVKYTDIDNDAPQYVKVIIDGVEYVMAKTYSSDVTYTDGCLYSYTTTLTEGSHTYQFITQDSNGASASTSTYTGPSVTASSGGNHLPVLTQFSHSPNSGTPETLFSFTVTYIDSDNNPPQYVRISLNGQNYNMSKLIANANNYRQGVIYVYSGNLAEGNYQYLFEADDGFGGVCTTPLIQGPSVSASGNSRPSLLDIVMDPSDGTTATTFRFSVTYRDAENEFGDIRIVIDGTEYVMLKLNYKDNTYTDGCTFIYTTKLSAGVHSYYFTATDGYQSVSTPVRST
ncbi:MAG: PPC domain-containing protein, partial [Thermoplasmata archaeon]